ncbi:MAG: GNAT family N-acetyltransferase, partial [Candidatus Micrarchaeota archaeon]|nr:GNAT family N-acetyltransferase [Candidatus Micrarchaeota archaeon]
MRKVRYGEHRLKSGVTVIYRPFVQGDSRRVSEILLDNFRPLEKEMGPTWWKEVIEEVYREENIPKLDRERDYRVVTMRGEVVGLGGFIPYTDTSGEMSNLSVNPKFHGMSIGKFLVLLRLGEKIEHGITKFYAYTGKQSGRIYQQLGFVEEPMPESPYGK